MVEDSDLFERLAETRPVNATFYERLSKAASEATRAGWSLDL